jgi:hypothetical protein
VANKGGVREEGAVGRLLAMERETGGGPAQPACRREEDKGGAGWLGGPKVEAQWRFGGGGPK